MRMFSFNLVLTAAVLLLAPTGFSQYPYQYRHPQFHPDDRVSHLERRIAELERQNDQMRDHIDQLADAIKKFAGEDLSLQERESKVWTCKMTSNRGRFFSASDPSLSKAKVQVMEKCTKSHGTTMFCEERSISCGQ